MKETKIWHIRLIPAGQFYFGGERNFSFGEKEDSSNYLVKSNYFPQQTGLLGMLRFVLLREAGLLPISKDNAAAAAALIGSESFDPNVDARQDFGAISDISPVFIEAEQAGKSVQRIFRASFERFLEDKGGTQKKMYPVALGERLEACFEGVQTRPFRPIALPYTAKSDIAPLLVEQQSAIVRDFDFDRDRTPMPDWPANGIFCTDWRVGIIKKNREEAFYKQCHFRFEKNGGRSYSFGFYAKIAAEVTIPSGIVVQLGGEKAPFVLEARLADAAENPFESPAAFYKGLFENTCRDLDKVVLLSDARANPDLFKHAETAIAPGVDFRNFRTDVNETLHYGAMQKSGANLVKPTRTNRYRLLSAGSVFYTETPDLVMEALNKHPQFTQIGYNHFIKILKQS